MSFHLKQRLHRCKNVLMHSKQKIMNSNLRIKNSSVSKHSIVVDLKCNLKNSSVTPSAIKFLLITVLYLLTSRDLRQSTIHVGMKQEIFSFKMPPKHSSHTCDRATSAHVGVVMS